MNTEVVFFYPDAGPGGGATLLTTPTTQAVAKALAHELGESGDFAAAALLDPYPADPSANPQPSLMDDFGKALLFPRFPSAIALEAVDDDGAAVIHGTLGIHFMSRAAATPVSKLAGTAHDLFFGYWFSRVRTPIGFFLGDSTEFAASSIPSWPAPGQEHATTDYLKPSAAQYAGGFGTNLNSLEPAPWDADTFGAEVATATEWRIATGLVTHPLPGEDTVYVVCAGDLVIWSGFRKQASDFNRAPPASVEEPGTQDGWKFWDEAALAAIGVQFFGGDAGIAITGSDDPDGGRYIRFLRPTPPSTLGSAATLIINQAASDSPAEITFFDGLQYRQTMDFSAGQLVVPVLDSAPSGQVYSDAGLVAVYNGSQKRLYMTERHGPPDDPGTFAPTSYQVFYWDLNVLS